MKPTITIEDDRGRGRWRFDLLRDRLAPEGAAACYRGCDEQGQAVFVKQIEARDAEGLERAAREVAALRRVGRHRAVIALLGTGQTPNGCRYRVLEWADVALHEALVDCAPALRPVLADVVEEAVSDALRAVHAAGLVHCDVAPNNIVRVAGRWKLADFDVCVRSGAPTVGQPRLPSYRSPGRANGGAASAAFDWYGLAAVVAQVRGRVATAGAALPRG